MQNNIIEEVENNFLFKINISNKSHFPEIGEDFYDEISFGIEFLIPSFSKKISYQEISFSYIFEIMKIEDPSNKNVQCEVSFNDNNNNNRPTLNVIEYELSEEQYLKINDYNYAKTSILNERFEDFIVNKIKNDFKRNFKKINEQFFFKEKINKENIILDKSLLKELEKNFYIDMNCFFEDIKKEKINKILEKNNILEVENLKDIINSIKIANSKFNHNKLNNDLNIKEINQKQNKFKV